MKRWYEQSVVYQIYPMSFNDSNSDGIGDIQGIIQKLDYLVSLGVEVIWLSPIYQSPMDDNGYDISDYYSIHPWFGTMDDFKQLLKEMHQRNLYLMMDLVVNHTSDEHPWFQAALTDPSSPYRDYYVFKKGHEIKQPLGSFFGGSAWEKTGEPDVYYLHMFSKKQPDLNWKNETLRKEIYRMMNFWLDLGVDGFRMDVIDLIGKEIDQGIIGNGPMLHPYLKEMHEACFLNRKTITVGETGGVTPETAVLYSSPESKELDMVFQFQHVGLDQVKGKDKWHLKPLDLVELKSVLSTWQEALYQKGWNSLYWSNHDQPRIVSRWGDDKQYRVESAKMFAALLHFMQGTPYIYQGEELGMTNIHLSDPSDLRDIEAINMMHEKKASWSMERIWESLNKKGRDNARTPVQWNSSAYAGFSTHEPWMKVNPNYIDINAENAIKDPDSIFYFYKKVISLRKIYPVIVNGKYQLHHPYHDQIFHYQRENEHEVLHVIANVSPLNVNYEYPLSGQLILSNYAHHQDDYQPYEVRVFHLKKVKE